MKEESFFGLLVHQRTNNDAILMFSFYAKAKHIKSWAGVRRVSGPEQGVQRILVPTRVNAITRFIDSNSLNIIPGCVIVAFENGVTINPVADIFQASPSVYSEDSQPSILSFSYDESVDEQNKPAMIVDGQHRLFGVAACQEDIPLLVVALINASLLEQAFQYVVINNKAVKVATTDVKSIIANIDEEALRNRLFQAGVRYGDASPILRDVNDSEISPFKGLLDWSYNVSKGGSPIVPLTAIEQSLRLLGALFNSALSGGYEEGDEDSLFQIYCAVWRGVKNHYSTVWGTEGSKLMRKVSINAINQFLAERLKILWQMGMVDIFKVQDVEQKSQEIMSKIPLDFWESEWLVKIQDNANIRNDIVSDLESITTNCASRKPWYTELKLLEHQE